MNNYEIEKDEVILYEGKVGYNKNYINIDFKLTSKKMIFEKEKGILKKNMELIDIVKLEDIKIYSGTVQVKQKLNEIQVQTFDKNFSIYASGVIEGTKIITKIVDTITGTTIIRRSAKQINETIDLVDKTFGVNTRHTVKTVVESGIKKTIINGIKKKKNTRN